jgi:hypothetical protein
MNKAIVTAKPGEPFVLIERDFNAPRDKVFKAFTTKELVEKWWVGPGYDVTVEKFDPQGRRIPLPRQLPPRITGAHHPDVRVRRYARTRPCVSRQDDTHRTRRQNTHAH